MDKHIFATAVVRQGARPVDLGRLGTKSLKARASKARRLDEESITSRARHSVAERPKSQPEGIPGASSGGGADIEDLLKALTPRLRQISEAQNLEYRLSKGKEKEEKTEAEA
ncbi:unnamed protein product [Effrenium voratum]|nr:unnamed protein product [Effrenium voratum]